MKKIPLVRTLTILTSFLLSSCAVNVSKSSKVEDSSFANSSQEASSSAVSSSLTSSSSTVSSSSSSSSSTASSSSQFNVDDILFDNPLSFFCPWIESLTKEDIDTVNYQVRYKNNEGDYSFCDYQETYVPKDQEDTNKVYSFLENCHILELRNRSSYGKVGEVTFSVAFKNQKKLDMYALTNNDIRHIYEDNKIVHFKQNASSFFVYTVTDISIPQMSSLFGYSYPKGYFQNSVSVQDRMNKFHYVHTLDTSKLDTMLFVPDDSINVSSEINDYNRYIISNDSEGSIIFESSKEFQI